MNDVKRAKYNIHKRYPLKNKPLSEIFPWLCCCLRWLPEKTDKNKERAKMIRGVEEKVEKLFDE
jgi:hypothetical protein